MFETAVFAFHFRWFLVAAVLVYVSFYGVSVFLFALKLFQLRRGGFVRSGNVVEGKLFALFQLSFLDFLFRSNDELLDESLI